VAAACELVRPKIILRSSFVYPKLFWVSQAGMNLPASATRVITMATITVSRLTNARKSISIPTPMRKNGMKIAFPTKSMRFIKGDVRGISLFRARPARNAPMIASMPANFDITPPRNTSTSTKMYCEMLSLYRLRNHRATIGNRKMITAEKAR